MRQLTAVDAQFLDMEDARNLGHVAFLAVVDPSTAPGGAIGVGDVCRIVGERLDLLPPFRWKLVPVPFGIARPYWIDDPDFDLDFHIRELALPPGGDERALAEQVARIVSRPLDRARPLWELYVIHGLPGGDVGVLTKMHHAAVDGVSGLEVMSVLFDERPEGPDRHGGPPRRADASSRTPGELEMLWRGLADRPVQRTRVLASLPRALADAARRPPAPDVRPLLGTPPPTRFNDRISGHRRLSLGRLPLDTVKEVKNRLGITVNDVVIALCAGALRDWLGDRGELPDRPLVAMVPVSVRAPGERGSFGNRVSAMFVPIPTDEPDPRRRLERAHDVMRAAKDVHRAVPAAMLQDFAEFVPPAVSASAARAAFRLVDRRRPAVNCVISNVPGPQTPLYCAGGRLRATYPVSVITDGMGLNITVMSYCGELDFGIVVDREHVEDPWPLVDNLREALDRYATLEA